MSSEGLRAARAKMAEAGVGAAAIEVFSHYYNQLEAGQTGVIRENEIEPLAQVPKAAEISVPEEVAREAFSKTVFIKLNGGLGTSMGLAGPKSLLPVRDGKNFLDIIAEQVLAARQEYGVRLPLILMHSFATRDASLAALQGYPQLVVDGLPLDFVQSREPKLLADSLEPADWPANPELAWCPSGHGDIYPSLVDSGLLDQLLDAGFRYATISNSDNLGAVPDAQLAGWFASTGAAFAMEVCRRSVNDRKGGHLARRLSDGHLVLRESAQTDPVDQEFFADENRHKYFNTNNLWVDLVALREAMTASGGVLGLPLIRNSKTVDPTDSASPKVIQVETAMGAAIEVFDNSVVLEVGRDRFAPVKKTNELLLLRSDCYQLDAQSAKLVAQVAELPKVDLDAKYYGMINDFQARIPHPISLSEASSFVVRGDFSFGADVKVCGDVTLASEDSQQLADGTVLS